MTYAKIPDLEPHCGSWIVINKVTGKPVCEVFVDNWRDLRELPSDRDWETYLGKETGV